jgi:hypothetical protein
VFDTIYEMEDGLLKPAASGHPIRVGKVRRDVHQVEQLTVSQPGAPSGVKIGSRDRVRRKGQTAGEVQDGPLAIGERNSGCVISDALGQLGPVFWE